MASIVALAAFLFGALAVCANREGVGTQASAGSHLNAASHSSLPAAAEAGAANGRTLNALFARPVPERHDTIAKACEGVQERSHGHDATPGSVQKMEKCVNALASFARETQLQRKKSAKANQNYHDDVLLAKKILRWLSYQTGRNENAYDQYKMKQAQRLQDVEKALHMQEGSFFQQSEAAAPPPTEFWPGASGSLSQGSLMAADARQVPMMGYQAMAANPQQVAQGFRMVPPHVEKEGSFFQQSEAAAPPQTEFWPGASGSLSQGSLMAADARQVPMMGYQAMAANPQQVAQGFRMVPPQPWANSAAMMTPGGQNFGLPPSLVGRRPSLLQVGNVGGGLQARLDKEAEKLEAAEAEDMREGIDPDE